MGLFGFGKKKEEAPEVCACAGACESTCGCGCESQEEKGGKGIIILGGGCTKCNELEAEAVKALAELGMEDVVDHITDFAVIATYGVMSTPALVVDGKVVVMGKVAKKAELVELIKKARG